MTYKLDGKTVQPHDVVGKAGRLEVHYKVQNVTGKDQDVTYNDGTGTLITETQKVVIPMVGSLTTVLPSNFVDVTSKEANIAGDGRGQTMMTYNMTLFGPIGSPTSEFGYSAKITDGVIPDATISALPVSPLDSPSFKGGAASHKSGAASGVTLTSGATKIDANVLKLRDGAQTLLAGLIQLSDGATKLNTGLAGDAAPGAAKLAVGAGTAASGANDLANGITTARDGSAKITGGLGTASSGAGDLVDPSNPANPCGVKQGLASVTLGVSNPGCSLADPTNAANRCGIKQIVDYVGGKLITASATGEISPRGVAR